MSCTIEILRSGIATSFQDKGREHVQYLGIVESGAADLDNYNLCNSILQNNNNETTIEFAYQGPKFLVKNNKCKIVVTGLVNFTITRNNHSVIQGDCYKTYLLEAGDVVDIISVINSVYGYLGFEGGIAVKKYFASTSTNSKSGIGQNEGRKIKNKDQFLLNISVPTNKHYKLEQIPQKNSNKKIRVLEGPQLDYFSNQGIDNFFHSEFLISNTTDKMGMRLVGKKIEHVKSANIKSEGIVKGSIQVPADGQPIVLLTDHQTIGGYPKIAVVISADYNNLIQKPAGSHIVFKKVNLREAEISFQLKQASLKAMIESIVKIN